MIRIVIDTNVLVSALLQAEGAEAAVLSSVVAGRVVWCLSPAILAEYADVLHRPKFSRIPRQHVDTLLALSGHALLVHPCLTITVSPDDPDNRFLECAEAARATYLVTGNQRHFPRLWLGTRIVNSRELLAAITAK